VISVRISKFRKDNLSTIDDLLLYTYLSVYAAEAANPHYDTAVYFDRNVKFFFFKDKKLMINVICENL